MSESQKNWIHNPFLDLLADAISFALLAKQTPNDILSKPNRFARSAILSSVFAVESAANCCLDAMQISRHLYDAVERMRVLEKFELLLMTRRPKATLDRGSTIVQSLVDLISLRNDYTHAKISKAPMVVEDEQTTPIRFQSLGPSTKFLQFPKNPNYWTDIHASQSVKIIVEFLNYFFIDLCLLSQDEIKGFLFDQMEYGQTRYIMEESEYKQIFNSARAEFACEFRFLKFEG